MVGFNPGAIWKHLSRSFWASVSFFCRMPANGMRQQAFCKVGIAYPDQKAIVRMTIFCFRAARYARMEPRELPAREQAPLRHLRLRSAAPTGLRGACSLLLVYPALLGLAPTKRGTAARRNPRLRNR